MEGYAAEMEQLLQSRFGLTIDDLLRVLRAIPKDTPLSEQEKLLADAGFGDIVADPAAHLESSLRAEADRRYAGPREIPGIERVLAALPADLSPMSVAGFLSTPQGGLDRGRRELTPLEWLLTGGDVEAVVAVAKLYDRFF